MAKVTLGDVARHAGVSRATADRVLNRRGGVSTLKERAVMTSARALGLDRNLDASPVKSLRVCVLMKPATQNSFYERLASGFREANLLFAPQAITAYVNHIDVLATDSIHAQLSRAAASYDALVIISPARKSIIEALEEISERIPVVTLATDLPLTTPHHYIGPDNYRAGRLAGELMGRLLGPAGGNVLVIAGLQEFSGHEERKNGFLSILRTEYPNCNIAAEIENFDQSSIAVGAIANAMRRIPDVRGIYNISQGNEEIAQRLAQLGSAKSYTFICHDLSETTRRLLLSGQVDVVIDQDPVLEARRAMESILAHYGRQHDSTSNTGTPLRVFFRENVLDPAVDRTL